MNPQDLVRQLITDEDCRLKPYRDTKGKLSIGVGRNLDDRGISMDEALYLCANDVKNVCIELDRALPWWKAQTEARQQVLANMAFNMGMPKLLGFKRMLGFMQAGDYANAAAEMRDSDWANQVGMRAARLAMMMQRG